MKDHLIIIKTLSISCTEYLDSSSIDNKETSIKFSYEIKKRPN